MACNSSARNDKSTTPHAALTTLVGKSSKHGSRVLIAKSSLDGRIREIVLETLHNSPWPRLAWAHLIVHTFCNFQSHTPNARENTHCYNGQYRLCGAPLRSNSSLAFCQDTSNQECIRQSLQRCIASCDSLTVNRPPLSSSKISMRQPCANFHCASTLWGVPLRQTPATSPATTPTNKTPSNARFDRRQKPLSLAVISDW